jgi:hypothetical protein
VEIFPNTWAIIPILCQYRIYHQRTNMTGLYYSLFNTLFCLKIHSRVHANPPFRLSTTRVIPRVSNNRKSDKQTRTRLQFSLTRVIFRVIELNSSKSWKEMG